MLKIRDTKNDLLYDRKVSKDYKVMERNMDYAQRLYSRNKKEEKIMSLIR